MGSVGYRIEGNEDDDMSDLYPGSYLFLFDDNLHDDCLTTSVSLLGYHLYGGFAFFFNSLFFKCIGLTSVELPSLHCIP